MRGRRGMDIPETRRGFDFKVELRETGNGCLAPTGTSGCCQDLHHLLYTCKEILYSFAMIESFMHKGLEELFEKGKSAKVQASLAERVSRRLDAIDTAKTLEALNIPGFDFHPLHGKPKRYSIHVNGPWCITFEWEGENAFRVNLENYH